MKNLLKRISLACLSSILMSSCALLYPEVDILCPSTKSSNNYNIGEPDTKSNDNLVSKANNNSDSKAFISYRIGVVADIPISNKFSFETGAHLAGKGNKQDNSGFEQKLNLTYIDVPLVTRYKLGEGGFSIYGGLQPSILVNAKLKTNFNGNENSQKVTDQYKTFDLAGSIGLGYNFDNGIGLNLGYDHGFTDINSEDFGGFKAYNRALRLGVRYNFNKNK